MLFQCILQNCNYCEALNRNNTLFAELQRHGRLTPNGDVFTPKDRIFVHWRPVQISRKYFSFVFVEGAQLAYTVLQGCIYYIQCLRQILQ
jgi:hypothetical protein